MTLLPLLDLPSEYNRFWNITINFLSKHFLFLLKLPCLESILTLGSTDHWIQRQQHRPKHITYIYGCYLELFTPVTELVKNNSLSHRHREKCVLSFVSFKISFSVNKTCFCTTTSATVPDNIFVCNGAHSQCNFQNTVYNLQPPPPPPPHWYWY